MNNEYGGEGAVAFRHEGVESELFAVDLLVNDVPVPVEAVLLGTHTGTEAKQQKECSNTIHVRGVSSFNSQVSSKPFWWLRLAKRPFGDRGDHQ